MIFLELADFGKVIDTQIFYDLIEYPEFEDEDNPTEDEEEALTVAQALLDEEELTAMEEAKSYLSSRYLIDEDFAKTGDARNRLLVLKVVDVALYNIYARLNPKQVPDLRLKRYDDAMTWFSDVNEAKINPDFTKPEDGTKNHVQYGSNKKREHYF